VRVADLVLAEPTSVILVDEVPTSEPVVDHAATATP
jgi:hypothetical protein